MPTTPNAGPTAAWDLLHRAHTQVSRRLSAELEERCQISLTTYDILDAVQRSSSGLRVGELRDTVALSQPSLSRHVERLISQGLLQGRSDPRHHRARTVTLTPTGRRLVVAAAAVHRATLREYRPGPPAVVPVR